MAPPAPPERPGVVGVGPIRKVLTMPHYDIIYSMPGFIQPVERQDVPVRSLFSMDQHLSPTHMDCTQPG